MYFLLTVWSSIQSTKQFPEMNLILTESEKIVEKLMLGHQKAKGFGLFHPILNEEHKKLIQELNGPFFVESDISSSELVRFFEEKIVIVLNVLYGDINAERKNSTIDDLKSGGLTLDLAIYLFPLIQKVSILLNNENNLFDSVFDKKLIRSSLIEFFELENVASEIDLFFLNPTGIIPKAYNVNEFKGWFIQELLDLRSNASDYESIYNQILEHLGHSIECGSLLE